MMQLVFIYLSYIQALFFIAFYKYFKRNNIPKLLIPLASVTGIILSPNIVSFFGLYKYPVYLLQFYLASTIIVYFFIYKKYTFNHVLAISFLLPFFNSFFWEFPLHLADFICNGLTKNLLLQSLHIAPLALWKNKILENKAKILKYSCWNWIVTILILRLRLAYSFGVFDRGLGVVNRLVSLMILLYSFTKLRG